VRRAKEKVVCVSLF